ncbi:Transcriptional regulator, LacI family [Acidisarcina polymorpha]|uniref:Transcriptional regulator, LacI family n=1 Tax=Acidisarcina polymorpha TaxID=2211140 RepID=A0A2Z5G0E6_9BACT|nr:LacI family DNA-binding transcriptional regulator [Acidisarcina polymorpha]AXC12234.1 Transcriptional regulator, LacI family [Acidisarcina polymorpha]
MDMTKSSGSITLVDVAREAGVSLKTASRVLNREVSVSGDTLERVQSAMARLGYRPNELARGLKAKKSATIGMVVKNLADPFAANVVKAVQDVARANGYIVILANSGWDPEVERSEVESLIRHQVEGLIISPLGGSKSTFLDIIPPGFHVVTLDQPIRKAAFDSVMINNRQSASDAVQHLLGHGYDRVVALSTRPWLHTSMERIAGYRDAMRERGFESLVASVDHESFITKEWLGGVLKEHKANALISMNWVCTIAALRGLKQNGKRPLRDIAFISFDDFELADTIQPTVSAVRQPTEEFGYEAAQLLFQRLRGTSQQRRRTIALPTTFIPRESCGCRL